jgi:hypothetical protein
MFEMLLLAFALPGGVVSDAFWDIPRCRTEKASRLIGEGLAVPVPSKAKLRRHGDVDVTCVAARIPGVSVWIEACSGPNYTYGRPSRVGRATDHLDERLIRWPKMPSDWSFEYGPRDVKGVSAAGRRWRYIGMIGGSIQYDGADARSAERLDEIMDAACWRGSDG